MLNVHIYSSNGYKYINMTRCEGIASFIYQKLGIFPETAYLYNIQQLSPDDSAQLGTDNRSPKQIVR
jgi:hypothetical protein